MSINTNLHVQTPGTWPIVPTTVTASANTSSSSSNTESRSSDSESSSSTVSRRTRRVVHTPKINRIDHEISVKRRKIIFDDKLKSDFTFQNWNGVSQVILAFIDNCHLIPFHDAQEHKRNTRVYVVWNQTFNTIDCYNYSNLCTKVIPSGKGNYFTNLFTELRCNEKKFVSIVPRGILRQWVASGIVGEEELSRTDEKNLLTIAQDIIYNSLIDSLKELSQNISKLASAQLVVLANQYGILEVPEALDYLRSRYRVSKSDEVVERLIALNKKMLLSFTEFCKSNPYSDLAEQMDWYDKLVDSRTSVISPLSEVSLNFVSLQLLFLAEEKQILSLNEVEAYQKLYYKTTLNSFEVSFLEEIHLRLIQYKHIIFAEMCTRNGPDPIENTIVPAQASPMPSEVKKFLNVDNF
ncbi:MAG: hypothetical protein WC222_05705 [Parachlamydiales bacterium]|jgi:hypothetical protein